MIKVRLPNFDKRLTDNISPGERRQLVPPPVAMPAPAPAVPVPAPVPIAPVLPGPPVADPIAVSVLGITTTGALRSSTRSLATSSIVTSGRMTTSLRSSTTSLPPSSTSTTTSSSSSSSSTTASASLSPSLTAPAETSLIFVNSFPADFPVETQPAQQIAGSGGRGYIFMKKNQAADSMLLFVTFFLVTLSLTLFFLRLTRYLDARREKSGRSSKEDQMVSEEMRWQEGRLVTERRIVREVSGAVPGIRNKVAKVAGGEEEGRSLLGSSAGVGYSKLRDNQGD